MLKPISESVEEKLVLWITIDLIEKFAAKFFNDIVL